MAGKDRRGSGRDGGATIVLKRIEAGGHGHHGGAWKVAYADFVTAMMAFFLLMWLLNATSEEQRRGIADFFSPVSALGQASSGSGQPMAGRTANSAGTLASDAGAIAIQPTPTRLTLDLEAEEDDQAESPAVLLGRGEGPVAGPGQPAARAERARATDADGPAGEALAGEPQPPSGRAGMTAAEAAAALAGVAAEAARQEAHREEFARREHAALAQAAEELRAAVRDDPALAELSRQLVVEIVPEGLRIQLLDAERSPMFALGGTLPHERARALLLKVAQIAARLPNELAVAGHTDAAPFRGPGDRGNWELSAERANVVRRMLGEAGVAERRIQSVAGHAARQPLLPDQPLAAANRRVAITLLRSAPGSAPGSMPGSGPAAPQGPGSRAALGGEALAVAHRAGTGPQR
jgi:chemotaxis protein MotB